MIFPKTFLNKNIQHITHHFEVQGEPYRAEAIFKAVARGDILYKKYGITGQRMRLYYENDLVCAGCKVQGKYFLAVQGRLQNRSKRNRNKFHLGPYTALGMRMTVDHRIPLSRGGADEYSNWQVMCEKCNSRKGSHRELKYETFINWRRLFSWKYILGIFKGNKIKLPRRVKWYVVD